MNIRQVAVVALLVSPIAYLTYSFWPTDEDRQSEASRQRALDQYAARMMPLIRAWGYHCSQIAHVSPKGVDVFGEVYLVVCAEGTRLRWTTHSTGGGSVRPWPNDDDK